MSEDQELLARISQLAGQINLHKAQPPSSQPGTNIHRSRVTRGYATWKAPRQAPYSARKRGARRHPTSHSLVLSKESSQSPANKGADGLGALQPTASYVSKQGRHRQLINSSVLDRVTQQRKQAIEESQQHKVLADDQRERQRMQQYMEGLDASQGSSTMRTSRTPSSKFHQIGLDGMTFQIMKKGSPHDIWNPTPKRMTVHGVTFVRSKRGNLYRSGMVRASKNVNGSKISSLCKNFTKTGHCNKGPACLYRHDPIAVAVCPTYLQRGTCPAGDSCDLSHDPIPERVPTCMHFLRGKCSNPTCRYGHIRVNPSAPVCKNFATLGYCSNGADCSNRHVHECPDYANTGTCPKKRCGLPHVDRAGQIRKQAAQSTNTSNSSDGQKVAETNQSDISSDEDNGAETDGEDVDSDDLNDELIEGVDALGRQALAEQHDFVGF